MGSDNLRQMHRECRRSRFPAHRQTSLCEVVDKRGGVRLDQTIESNVKWGYKHLAVGFEESFFVRSSPQTSATIVLHLVNDSCESR